MPRSSAVAVSFLALGSLAACGDTAPAASPPPPTATAAGALVIEMRGIAFAPRTARVKVGRTVRWVNRDTAKHNVDSKAFKSRTFGRGGSFSYRAKRAGTFAYLCTVHPFMKGKLVVTAAK